MQEKLSVKGNIIKYNRQTLANSIDDILNSRFKNIDDLDKWMDDLHDPYLLAGMKEAVDRIKYAKENKQKVIIFGDYDVDWVTSTSILMHFFKTLEMQVSYRLPHRVKDWYWLKDYFIGTIINYINYFPIITIYIWTKIFNWTTPRITTIITFK